MKASRKKAKAAKAKSAKAKATKVRRTKAKSKKTKVEKAKARNSKTNKPKRATPAAPPPATRDIKSLIEYLDLPSLHEDEIKIIRDCCTAALDLRETLQTRSVDATLAHVAAEFCYTKSGASSTVSIWKNGFKVGETTQADADARGILPCG